MAKTRAIVKRRKAVRNIRKITRTMELIATARFRKAMERAQQAEAFTRRIGELVADLGSSAASADHPLLQSRPIRRTALLVLSANRGLCGGFNANIARLALRAHEELAALGTVYLEVSGKRGINFLKYRGLPASRTYTQFEDKPTYTDVEPIAQHLLDDYLSGAFDRLDVAYTRFVSMGRQVPEVATLLPVTQIGAEVSSPSPAGGRMPQYLFLPSAEDILDELVPMSFRVRLFKCFLDSAVSEQIARMVAMKGATENAGNLLRDLSMAYNRARQSQITSELAEIIGTAEALK